MKNHIAKVIVTGSSGTIGTALCERLLEERYQVTGVDIRHNMWNPEVDKITIIGDMRDRDIIYKLPKSHDLMIHLAANARVFALVQKPLLAKDNFEMVFNALEYCRQCNTKRIIFSSSREVFGNSDNIRCKEDDVGIKNCESPYSSTKLAGELLIIAYQSCYKLDYIILRFSNVYGKYDNSDRFIPLFIKKAKLNDEMVVFGKDKILDFTYISDCIDGIMKSIENFDRVKNNTFNISYGEGISLVELAQVIIAKTGSRSKLTIEDNRCGEVLKFVADISKARALLDYNPATSITEGLDKSLDYYSTIL